MLQTLLFGFVGLEITDEGIKQNEIKLPEKLEFLEIRGWE